MRPSRSLACLLAALVLAVSGGAAAADGTSSAPAPVPAPPPAGYCRAAPPSGWPEIGAGTVPDLTPFQDYRAGLAIPAGPAAAGIRIADVEYEWSSSHVELAGLDLPVAGASGLDPGYNARDHGTAVLGVLGGSDDGRGITGLATGATLLPLSPIITGPGGGYQPDATIAKAAKGLRAGDVLLVELQALLTPDGSRILAPIEYYPAVRAAIAAAVKRGIVVVEPAGNGNLDIGGLGPSWLADPADPLASGALIVGAGGSGAGRDAGVADRRRVPGSNYGARVDLQGFGAAVVTSGYTDLSGAASADRSYTACFDGTSSASATVAGAVAVLQSAAIARTGAPLTPARVRELLTGTGLPQVAAPADGNTSPQNIGPRPQVAAAIAAVGSTQSPPPPAAPDGGAPTPVPTVTPSVATAIPAPFDVASVTRVPQAAVAPSATVLAARGLTLRLDRSARRLVVMLRDAPAAAVVRRGSRTLRSRHGRIVLTGIRPGRFVLTVRAPATGGVAYRTVTFRVTVPARGAVRVDRI